MWLRSPQGAPSGQLYVHDVGGLWTWWNLLRDPFENTFKILRTLFCKMPMFGLTSHEIANFCNPTMTLHFSLTRSTLRCFSCYIRRGQWGLLSFTEDNRCRVGLFAVSKKPKTIDGVLTPRQRLILDFRTTNMMFEAPPRTELGSLSALTQSILTPAEAAAPESEAPDDTKPTAAEAELELCPDQKLFCSGADIQDCFYAVRIPKDMTKFFCLCRDVTSQQVSLISGGGFGVKAGRTYSPCVTVLPMGFSWSFYLVQHLHELAVRWSLGVPDSNILDDEQHQSFLMRVLKEDATLRQRTCTFSFGAIMQYSQTSSFARFGAVGFFHSRGRGGSVTIPHCGGFYRW